MLSMMANLGAGQDSPCPVPFAFTYSPADIHSQLFHYSPFRHHPHGFLPHRTSSLFSDPIRRLAMARLPPPRKALSGRNSKPLTSFCIRDILGRESEKRGSRARPDSVTSSSVANGCNDGKLLLSERLDPTRSLTASTSSSCCTSPKGPCNMTVSGTRIVRPWAPSPCSPDTEMSSDDGMEVFIDSAVSKNDGEEEEIRVDDDLPCVGRQRSRGGKSGVSPLDALMAMTNKTFEGLGSPDSAEAKRRDQAALFSKHAPPKKRRKSRTAFTNQQIYELEKRFLYQKYLTPADRDDIAHTLGLTNAQVITWFQNRRAKLKRDLEELKNDVTAARKHSVHKTIAGTVAEMKLRKVHQQVLQKAFDEQDGGEAFSGNISSLPPSPSSSSTARTTPSSCSPSPALSLTSSFRTLSPSDASCYSSKVPDESRENELNSSHRNDEITVASNQSENDCAGSDLHVTIDKFKEVDDSLPQLESSVSSPDCDGSEEHRVADVVDVSEEGGDDTKEVVNGEHETEVIMSQEEDMRTQEEPENLSLKSADP